MLKLCKWIYKLGYDRGFQNGLEEAENRLKSDYFLKKALENKSYDL